MAVAATITNLSLVLAISVSAASLAAHAQPTAKIARIGYLNATSAASVAPRIEAFRQGLRDVGYEEGKNIVIEYRHADGRLERLGSLAAELVRLNVEVIVSSGPADTKAAKGATSTIPIVMAWNNDPVGSGFVASLARPGGNITGLSSLSSGLSGKQLELLKEVVPRLSRVAVFGNSEEPGNEQNLTEVELAARAFGTKTHIFDVRSPRNIETAFRAAAKESANAGLVLPSPISALHRAEFAERAMKNRLPIVYWRSEAVAAGGLMSYGPSFNDLFRRAATYVAKILKGARPADLPVEQPTKFELVINLKTAKALGLTIPQSILLRADRVVE
jgi:putative tryptophan/tyrosine transport system substrate-binding protein